MKKGESILQLAAVCRRLETEREKVLPFGLPKESAFEDSIDDSPPKELKGVLNSILAIRFYFLTFFFIFFSQLYWFGIIWETFGVV